MKKTCYTEEQIAFTLKQAETCTRVGEVCRKMGISEAIFYTYSVTKGRYLIIHNILISVVVWR